MREVYRYRFEPGVPLEEVEETVVLGLIGTESLHGEAQVRLDARHLLDAPSHTLVIDAATPVGRDFNLLTAGFLAREFGPDSFRVGRVSGDAPARGAA